MSDDDIMRHYKMYEIIKNAEETYRSQAQKARKWVIYSSELDLAYDKIFKLMGSSFAEADKMVKAFRGSMLIPLVKEHFSFCFQTEEDHLVFLLRHNINIRTNERSCKLLVDDGKESYDDIPAEVEFWNDYLTFHWRGRSPNGYSQYHRDLDYGPAKVVVALDGRYTIQHFVNGDLAAGHRNWRKRCIAHNHWIKRIADRKANKT